MPPSNQPLRARGRGPTLPVGGGDDGRHAHVPRGARADRPRAAALRRGPRRLRLRHESDPGLGTRTVGPRRGPRPHGCGRIDGRPDVPPEGRARERGGLDPGRLVLLAGVGGPAGERGGRRDGGGRAGRQRRRARPGRPGAGPVGARGRPRPQRHHARRCPGAPRRGLLRRPDLRHHGVRRGATGVLDRQRRAGSAPRRRAARRSPPTPCRRPSTGAGPPLRTDQPGVGSESAPGDRHGRRRRLLEDHHVRERLARQQPFVGAGGRQHVGRARTRSA